MNTNKSIPSAAQVARVLLDLAEQDQDENQELMTNMRLQKLLYYVQGWSLAVRGELAFNEPMQAWRHGPVVRPIYDRLKKYGKDPVHSKDFVEQGIDDDLRSFIASIWEDYRGYSAIALANKTHEESPWQEARGGLPEGANCEEEITRESMYEFFSSQMPQLVNFQSHTPDPSWFEEPSPFAAC